MPNYHPEGLFRDGKMSTAAKNKNYGSKSINQLWHLNGKCPEGTIPIRRTKKDDILRASNMKSYGRKTNFSTISKPESGRPGGVGNQNGHQVTSFSIFIISDLCLY